MVLFICYGLVLVVASVVGEGPVYLPHGRIDFADLVHRILLFGLGVGSVLLGIYLLHPQ